MSYGAGFDWALSEKDSIEQIKTAYALGINVSRFLSHDIPTFL
jgi:hypothetical protein